MAQRCPACAEALPDTPALQGIDRLHGIPGTFHVAVCSACGSGLTLPVVDEGKLHLFYPADYNAFALPGSPPLRAAATLLFRLRYRRGLRKSPLVSLAQRPAGRLLDVGGGRGDLGVTLQPRGWSVMSIDPSDSACAEARRRGVPSEAGTLTNLPERVAGPYDAIVFQHSLEHFADPGKDLAATRGLLADDGVVVVTVPNFGSWQRRRFGSAWFHLDLPRHRTHFSPAGLEALLRRSGFERVELSTSTSADGLPMSLQYRFRGGPARGSGRYVVTAFGLMALPFTAGLNALAGHGDFLHAIAIGR